jgi:hypothetical protein
MALWGAYRGAYFHHTLPVESIFIWMHLPEKMVAMKALLSYNGYRK